jgi:hypothetical protein
MSQHGWRRKIDRLCAHCPIRCEQPLEPVYDIVDKLQRLVVRMGDLPFIGDVDEVYKWANVARKYVELPSGCVYLWDLCVLFSCFSKGNVRHLEDEDEESSLKNFLGRRFLQLEAYSQHYI